jgi:alkylation response protein AidB-like acyl-CoA dehydrogenase
MDFEDSPEQAAFRARARDWIAANAPVHLHDAIAQAGLADEIFETPELIEAAFAWQKRKAEAGWACLDWPKAYGGADASPIQRIIWDQEEGVYARLNTMFVVGRGMCAPTLMAYGTDVDKRKHLPRIASGEEIWCQLFSEPEAGSDLAGLRTRAVRDGEDWVIDGQKVWTSFAHRARYGILLARTDPTLPKHAGLTMFYVDMSSAGIEVRPIKQANGQADFNEVYLTALRVRDAQRLGEVNKGWRVALTTLMNERLAVGAVMPTGVPELVRLCAETPAAGFATALDDPHVRSRIAHWETRASGLRNTALRAISAIAKGEEPGPENSITKLVVAQLLQEIAAFGIDLQGASGLLAGAEAPAAGRFQAMLLRSPGVRIEGGTDEILRNIIAERVLGLPADMRIDKDAPFNEIGKTSR